MAYLLNCLQKNTSEIIKPVTLIMNQYINTGIFPEDMKMAKVILLHKKGELNNIANYRSWKTSFVWF